ncbi:MAG TPA: replication-relaxation family protein [Anaeromyxobacteraceae bacterium]|nr:replication-relaxation family protein [Anaeromyxobacteraceae bacterium]
MSWRRARGESKRRFLVPRRREEDVLRLLEYLGTARYASTDQVRRLLGDERGHKALERWLVRHSSEPGRPFLRRLGYRRTDGTPVAVWTLGRGGRERALELGWARRLPATREVGHQFLDHALRLNAVLLDLVLALRARGAGALADMPFRWRGEERADLEFEMFQRHLGITARVALRPDALLTFPQRRRRLFLEAETGSQGVYAANPQRAGAVLRKVERYAAFFLGRSGGTSRTWYERAFADGFAPRLVFLVHSEERRTRVERALEGWEDALSPERFRAVALTFAEAATVLEAYLPGALPAAAAPSAAGRLLGAVNPPDSAATAPHRHSTS